MTDSGFFASVKYIHITIRVNIVKTITLYTHRILIINSIISIVTSPQ